MNTIQHKAKINWLTVYVLVLYPLAIISSIVCYGINFGIGGKEVIFAIVGYYGSNIAVGIGFHRLWSHGAFKVHKLIEVILVFLTAGTLQGPVLAWASDHYKHHTYTDKESDPHSPFRFKNRFKGFLWSHIGWMLVGEGSYKHIDKSVMHKLGKKKILRWQLKYYWQLAVLMNVIIPTALGYAIGGDIQTALAGFLFIGLGRAMQQQMTFCVNSLCHIIGSRKYYAGTARDIWWLFFLLLGENWHNFHHAFARDYRNGVKWYHLDVHKWIIVLMAKLGLAYDLVKTSEERIKAKINATNETMVNDIRIRLEAIEQAARNLAVMANNKLTQAERSAGEFASRVHEKIKSIEETAQSLAYTVRSFLESRDELTEKLANKAAAKLKELENMAHNLRFGIINFSDG